MEESKQNKIVLLRQMIENAERNIVAAKQILRQLDSGSKKMVVKDTQVDQIIEGIFDGEKMIALDGRRYPVPANYASKSKLVEGDILKLTITEDGSFLYKQISPVERRRITGIVMRDSSGKYYINSEGRKYKVLLASVTYFKAQEGDEVILVVPKEKISRWGAIEAVVDRTEDDTASLDDELESKAEEVNKEKKVKEAENSKVHSKSRKSEVIENEWIPNIEEIKEEAEQPSMVSGNEEISEISDELSV